MHGLVTRIALRIFSRYPSVKAVSKIRSVRVMLLPEGVGQVAVVRLAGTFFVYDEETQQRLYSGADQLMTISHSPQGLLTIQVSQKEATLTARAVRLVSEQPICVGEHLYRGCIVVRCMGKALLVLNIIRIEEYLKGVVPAEILSSSRTEILSRIPREALKAQAVASRTFACHRILLNRPIYDVDATVLNQIYKGIGVEAEASSEAVDDTVGEVLAYGDQLANTLFHAACGGMTEDSKHVWRRAVPYLLPVECSSCSWFAEFHWRLNLEKEEFGTLLRPYIQGSALINIEIAAHTPAGRVKTLRIVTERGVWEVKVDVVRHAVGVDRLRSGIFSITSTKDSVVFEGRGWGHGVGMCQNGTIELASKGYSYQEILKKYYPGTRLCRVTRFGEG